MSAEALADLLLALRENASLASEMVDAARADGGPQFGRIEVLAERQAQQLTVIVFNTSVLKGAG